MYMYVYICHGSKRTKDQGDKREWGQVTKGPRDQWGKAIGPKDHGQGTKVPKDQMAKYLFVLYLGARTPSNFMNQPQQCGTLSPQKIFRLALLPLSPVRWQIIGSIQTSSHSLLSLKYFAARAMAHYFPGLPPEEVQEFLNDDDANFDVNGREGDLPLG